MANTTVVHIEDDHSEFNRAADRAFDRSVPDTVFWDETRINYRAKIAAQLGLSIAAQVSIAIDVYTGPDGSSDHPYAVY